MATPIVHHKKADLAYAFLREQIVNGTFAPGQRMTLAELSGAGARTQFRFNRDFPSPGRNGFVYHLAPSDIPVDRIHNNGIMRACLNF